MLNFIVWNKNNYKRTKRPKEIKKKYFQWEFKLLNDK